jgi:uncharacterized protein YcbK (DUF882 family)
VRGSEHWREPVPGRRRFIAALGGAAGAWLLDRAAPAAAQPSVERSLSFYNLHTGESVRAAYWADGAYQTDALTAIDRVLRDYRTGEVRSMDRRLLDLLHALRLDLGTSAAFHVISGYRSPATNAMLRQQGHAVASHSLHMEGKASDVRLPGVDLDTLHRAAVARRAGGVGYYLGPQFVHVDVGPVRYW